MVNKNNNAPTIGIAGDILSDKNGQLIVKKKDSN